MKSLICAFLLIIYVFSISSCSKDELDIKHFIKIYNSDSPSSDQVISAQQLKDGSYLVYCKTHDDTPYFFRLNEDGSFVEDMITMNDILKKYKVTLGLKKNNEGERVFVVTLPDKDIFYIYQIEEHPTLSLKFLGTYDLQDENTNGFSPLLLDFLPTSDSSLLMLSTSKYNEIQFGKLDKSMKKVATSFITFNPLAKEIAPQYPINSTNTFYHFIRVFSKNGKDLYYFIKSFENNTFTFNYFDLNLNSFHSIDVKPTVLEAITLANKNEIIGVLNEEYYNYSFYKEKDTIPSYSFTQYDQDGTKHQSMDTLQINKKTILVVAGSSNHGRAMCMFFDAKNPRFISKLSFGSSNSLDTRVLIVTKDNGLALIGTTTVMGFSSKIFMIKLSEDEIKKELIKNGTTF